MKDRIAKIRTSLERQIGQCQALRSQRSSASQRQTEAEIALKDTQHAQLIIQEVAKATQDQLRYRIEEPVSLALSAVFEEPYSLNMEFPVRRGRTECDLKWIKAGHEYPDLEYCGGGGAVDVAAFGLQVAVLVLMKGRARPILIQDEPLKWLKGGELPERGAMMIREISREVGVQILAVSHIPEQKAGSDRVFNMSLGRDGVTCVRVEDKI